jgi:hypothetical protein
MAKKKLDETAIANELREGSLFFRPKVEEKKEAPTEKEQPKPTPPAKKEPHSPAPSTDKPHTDDTATPRYHDTVIPRHHDTIIETTRKAVKQLGKEAATHRFTVDEKKALKSIERDYEVKDIRTSENEITRISINYMIEDYRKNGDESILARVLKLLNS